MDNEYLNKNKNDINYEEFYIDLKNQDYLNVEKCNKIQSNNFLEEDNLTQHENLANNNEIKILSSKIEGINNYIDELKSCIN